jgi:hypothetical protein
MNKRKIPTLSNQKESLKQASMVLEDFLWSVQRIKPEQLRMITDFVRRNVENQDSIVAKGYRSTDPNKHFLIGVLPRLFQDRELFPQNEDIADFADTALHLKMSRTEKRSRYEIIGKVVCETDLLDEKQLTGLVTALEQLVGNKDKLAQMIEKKKTGSFSWNETIQELLKV